MKIKKVFLGGTCNGSLWRNYFIDGLNIDYFNPVVENWTPECRIEELKQRQECDFCLYCITPKMTGVYSIAEVVDDSNKKPTKTILVIKESDDGNIYTDSQLKSLKAVGDMVEKNGGKVFYDIVLAINFLNNSI